MQTESCRDPPLCGRFHPDVGMLARSALIVSCRGRHKVMFPTVRLAETLRVAEALGVSITVNDPNA
jgi:hypothetical protein